MLFKANQLLHMAKLLDAIQIGEFALSAGGTSKYYFDGRYLSLHPQTANLIAALFLEKLMVTPVDAIGGPAHGAIPLASGLMIRSEHLRNYSLRGFYVRSKAKSHGTQRLIEGALEKGMPVAILDDTVSTGKGILSAIDAVESFGCEVKLTLAVLDRQEGGSDRILERGIPFFRILETTSTGRIQVVNRMRRKRRS